MEKTTESNLNSLVTRYSKLMQSQKRDSSEITKTFDLINKLVRNKLNKDLLAISTIKFINERFKNVKYFDINTKRNPKLLIDEFVKTNEITTLINKNIFHGENITDIIERIELELHKKIGVSYDELLFNSKMTKFKKFKKELLLNILKNYYDSNHFIILFLKNEKISQNIIDNSLSYFKNALKNSKVKYGDFILSLYYEKQTLRLIKRTL